MQIRQILARLYIYISWGKSKHDHLLFQLVGQMRCCYTSERLRVDDL